ncbi:MAG TPA: DUF892 family protein [Elusimicrobiota bacterium]|jgi:rubrerythrin|nr:DUF892 family protein [Elusimicrobiota bacterium]
MKPETMQELLLQAIETEKGGVQVYEAALKVIRNEDLKGEFEKYLDQTRMHVEILEDVLRKFGIDPEQSTPGREIVKAKGEALVEWIERALKAGDEAAAQLVAAECVVDAETKDHLNWELLAQVAKGMSDDERAEVLKKAVERVEEEEDKHLYHTLGWTRELWLEALELPAVLPPVEERKDVDTALEAAKAQQERGRFLRKGRAARSARTTRGRRHGRKTAKS